MKHPGRIRRIAHDDQVRLVRNSRVAQVKRRFKSHVSHIDTRRRHDSVGLGERRADQRRQSGPQRRQQCETLGTTGKQQDMGLRKTMAQRDGTHRGSLVVRRRVVREVGETLRQSSHQPVRGVVVPKIDGEIEHPRLRRPITVIAQRKRQG